MREDTVFIIHPDTKQPHTLAEMVEISKVPLNTIRGRLGRGDKGWQLWRPAGTRSKDFDPGNSNGDIKQVKCAETDKFIY